MAEAKTNAELLKLVAGDDIRAFEALYQKFSGRMLGYALNILNDKFVCEDLIQNIFIDFWSKRKGHQIDNLEGYLFRAVKFQIFKYFRDHKFSNDDLTRLNLIEVSVQSSKNLEYQELEAAIHACVSKLPPRCKEIFQLSRFEHKSNKEISEALDISMQAVKNQVSKALIFIKGNLQKDEHILFFLILFGLQVMS